jgi:hypothetical protein
VSGRQWLVLADPAREQVVARLPRTAGNPRQHGVSRLLGDLELHRPSRLLLHHCGPGPHPSAQKDVIHPQGNQVTAPQLAVDRQVEHGEVPQPLLKLIRMAQTSSSLSGGFWPISLPRFHGATLLARGSS